MIRNLGERNGSFSLKVNLHFPIPELTVTTADSYDHAIKSVDGAREEAQRLECASPRRVEFASAVAKLFRLRNSPVGACQPDCELLCGLSAVMPAQVRPHQQSNNGFLEALH